MHLRTLLSSVLLLGCLCAYSPEQELKQLNQTGWLLEITYLKNAPPAYHNVFLPGSLVSGGWFARFGHIPGWELPAGAAPIRAVRISNRLRNDRVRVTVSVLRGKRIMDTEETVVTFELLENQKMVVTELEKFGVEPFEIRAFKTDPLPGSQPDISNEIKSIEVIGIEAVASDLPRNKLTLRNLSNKSIEALRIDIFQGDRLRITAQRQGLEGRLLVLAGDTVQVNVSMAVEAAGSAGAYAPALSAQQKYVIRSVIFSDGTAEGAIEDPYSPAAFQIVSAGRRIELQKTLPLFTAALDSPDDSLTQGVKKLRSQLKKITVPIADAEIANLQQRFPSHDAEFLRDGVGVGISLMREEMLNQLRHFENNPNGKDFRSWLIDNTARYSQWLERLEPAAPPQP
jgi:hypothetical protein